MWIGAMDGRGYGMIRREGRTQRVHRYFWEQMYGPVPEGMQLDHLCRNRACYELAHLEVVTPAENTRRGVGPAALHAKKTTCPAGHSYDVVRDGKRRCSICDRVARQKYKAGKRLAPW